MYSRNNKVKLARFRMHIVDNIEIHCGFLSMALNKINLDDGDVRLVKDNVVMCLENGKYRMDFDLKHTGEIKFHIQKDEFDIFDFNVEKHYKNNDIPVDDLVYLETRLLKVIININDQRPDIINDKEIDSYRRNILLKRYI